MKSDVNHADSASQQQSPNLRLSCLKTRRKRWLDVHLWLGLSLGFLLSIYGITGSILVFYPEIDEWLNSELLTVKPPADSAAYQPLADIFEPGRVGNAFLPTLRNYARLDENAGVLPSDCVTRYFCANVVGYGQLQIQQKLVS